MERVQSVVVGGGAVGLSIARSLSLRRTALAGTDRERDRETASVALIERHALLGFETSSRSSEVLHAGLYYSPSALKTRMCVQGRQRLLDFMQRHGIAHSLCGKLIVSAGGKEKESDSSSSNLRALYGNGLENGLSDLVFLRSQEEIRRFEPDVVGNEGIFSPYSGIFDSHQVICALERECEQLGVYIFTNCAFESAIRASCRGVGEYSNSRYVVKTNRGDIACNEIINCAGLVSPQVAHRMEGIYRDSIPRPYYSKGNYFKLVGSRSSSLFKHLVYPMPSNGGLGVHATLDLTGAVRFGPDTEWIERPLSTQGDGILYEDQYEHDINQLSVPSLNYQVNEQSLQQFYSAIETYWPAIHNYTLQADYCGIRPKLCGPSLPSTANNANSKFKMSAAADFLVHDEKTHHLPGVICLYGIESPGWTSSLSLADHVVERLSQLQ